MMDREKLLEILDKVCDGAVCNTCKFLCVGGDCEAEYLADKILDLHRANLESKKVTGPEILKLYEEWNNSDTDATKALFSDHLADFINNRLTGPE